MYKNDFSGGFPRNGKPDTPRDSYSSEFRERIGVKLARKKENRPNCQTYDQSERLR
jgi:hypothetical protein